MEDVKHVCASKLSFSRVAGKFNLLFDYAFQNRGDHVEKTVRIRKKNLQMYDINQLL